MTGQRALVIATNHAALDIGKPTGVFASELTAAYYAFLDAGMQVDVASPAGGLIPVERLSVNAIIRTHTDDRFLGDAVLREKINNSLIISSVDIDAYDIVYLAGGWGAAFDLGFSHALAAKITEANAAGLIIGGVCHGPLGLINATTADGKLVEGRRITGVSNRQVAISGSATHRSILRLNSEIGERCTRPVVACPTCSRITGSSTATWSLGRIRMPALWSPERCSDLLRSVWLAARRQASSDAGSASESLKSGR